ncbi:MAG TPA: EVE domain-containing protein [Chloroflexota bacterium]|nr:EVE domain-containing protein [Chloroflexota bacterium]
MAGTYWMLVSSPENFERARAMGFSILAMKGRHRRKAERVRPGDRVVYYAVGQKAFAGTFTVTSPFFESHEPLFESKKTGEDYPYRFAVRPDVVLPPGQFVPAEGLLADLAFVRKWPAEHWHLAFQGNVHVLDAADFAVIEAALQRCAADTGVPALEGGRR